MNTAHARRDRQIRMALQAIADAKPNPLGSYFDQIRLVALLVGVAKAALAVANLDAAEEHEEENGQP